MNRSQGTPRSALDGQGRCSLLPHFSLISTRDGRPPLLVDLIRASALGPEDYVLEKLVRPYVEVLSYLLFESAYTQQLIAAGERDANRRRFEIGTFIGLDG